MEGGGYVIILLLEFHLIVCYSMDQAISFFGQAGTAKLIMFNPLTTHDVNLPAGYSSLFLCITLSSNLLFSATFVICNSLVESTKYLTAGTNYNMR